MVDPLEGLRQALADRYIIDREIGHGGSATVYLAQDRKLLRTVAIKVLAPELSLAVRTERFLQEIEISAGFQHPHILPLHDSGEAAGLFYYVMPYVSGETLRERLARDGRLPLDEAIRITQEAASALSYAHAQGIIHRDIKPANILLSAGHAMVADFGIARAIRESDSEGLTQTGMSLGTPAYMSPEQATGQAIDGRSDIYSLGCVLYEMLSGTPPFIGPNAQSLLAQHIVDPVPPLRRGRSDIPRNVSRVLEQALAKRPDERFRTASEFAAALGGPDSASIPDLRWAYRAAASVAVLAVAIVGIRAILRSRADGAHAADAYASAGIDTLRYVVFPFAYKDVPRARLNADQLLVDALSRWRGITVADPFHVKEALPPQGTGDLSTGDAQRIAVQLGSGRFARGEISRIGDSIRVHAVLYDAEGGGTGLRDGTVKLRSDVAHADSAFDRLADRLLFADATSGSLLDSNTTTNSFPARQQYARGLAAVEQWDLTGADSAFVAATAHDPRYAQAFLWTAQVRFWSGAPLPTWASAAERAAAGRERLSRRGRTLSDAIAAFAHGDIAQACVTWERSTREDRYDFAAWYGSAMCLTRDSIVVRDAASPSGWRFRSSYHHALRSYERAFRLNPAIHTSFRTGAYRSLRRLLMTDGDNVRWGRAAPPDTGRFAAEAAWRGDSIVLVPYRFAAFSLGHGTSGREKDAAAMHERELLHDIAVSWVSAFPTSGDALEALAISLELLGDPAALDTLERARALTQDTDQRIHIASSEVWLRLKASLPSDLAGVGAACALADSLLALPASERRSHAWPLAALAVLRGRAALAAGLAREPESTQMLDVPAPLVRDAPALLVFAALGGPRDSLNNLEQRVELTIQNSIALEAREEARLAWLARPASLAFPEYQLQSLRNLAGHGDYVVDAEAAYLLGDTSTVRRVFADLGAYRRTRRPADITFDGLYPEASVIAAIGDRRSAVAWIDPTLNSLSAAAPGVLADFTRAGALVRTMTLRAELARALGDRATAARWARAVATLWVGADEFLQPAVRRMLELSR